MLQASFACNNYYCIENKLAERLASLKQPEWIQKGSSQAKPIIWSADLNTTSCKREQESYDARSRSGEILSNEASLTVLEAFKLANHKTIT